MAPKAPEEIEGYARYRCLIAHQCQNDDKVLYYGGGGMWPFTGPWWTEEPRLAALFPSTSNPYGNPELEVAIKKARKDRGSCGRSPWRSLSRSLGTPWRCMWGSLWWPWGIIWVHFSQPRRTLVEPYLPPCRPSCASSRAIWRLHPSLRLGCTLDTA